MSARADITLTTPLAEVPGITPRVAEALRDLGPRNVGQLLAYLPARHERLEAESPIADLVPGRIGSARGTVSATRVVRGRAPRFEVVLIDDTGRLDLVFFNQAYLRDKIHPGDRLRVQGKVGRRAGGAQLANPKWERLPAEGDEPAASEERLRPVYPASEALGSPAIEKAVARVLPAADLIEDHLPEPFRTERQMPALSRAYRMIHAPADEAEAAAARRRLAYDELLLLQLGLALKRRERGGAGTAPALRWTEQIDRHIRARMPFTLTPAQDEVVREVAADLSRDTPANRLIQGDVGSGKTAVAVYAMLMAVASGHQAALMAPTELLAEQHAQSIGAMLKGSDVRLALLTGAGGGGSAGGETRRREVLEALAAGEIDVVIGTHAILTEGVRFASLAVAVIDEQHRFGVHQRSRLRAKGVGSTEATARRGAAQGRLGGAGADPRAAVGGHTSPHMLVMTATPIPRTLAMTLFGDLDVSTITGLPPGRKPVKTRVVGPDAASEVYVWLAKQLRGGAQAYIVAPTIDPIEASPPVGEGAGAVPLASVREVRERLERGPLAGLRLAEMHGQMRADERGEVMARFRAGEIDALVATTVIEVGVDVPNASVMVVEHAERFGLAQLHQLRGRVGRGKRASACVLIGQATTEDAAARLRVMAQTSDGFQLAEKDLEIRGFGDVLGVRQSGMPPFRVAELPRDLDLLALARRDALAWAERSPRLDGPGEGTIRRRLEKAHGQWLDLAGVA
ncbi:MAG: ATP-dependent DNA helicase RecG [Phycisphaerae bacterium]|nr:ATP-dependent DNA helicase RecG [Phycisphaerae bacterium]